MLNGHARMGLLARVHARSVLARLSAGLICSYLATTGYTQVISQVAPVVIAEPQVDLQAEALAKGLEMEKERLWSDAVRHYESVSRDFPENATLYQRLIISRLHYDVNRRYQDESFLASVRELSTSQALDLYSEVLANLNTHYVDNVDWQRIMIHGTAALEVALTEEKFLGRTLANVPTEKIEAFRQSIHRKTRSRSTATRFDLRGTVAFVAQIAQQELGLSGTATVLEFLGGTVSTLDPYTRLLSPSQLDEMFSNIEGNFVGLGIELKTDEDSLRILSVIPNGPAEEAGIVAGERIVRVENSHTSEMSPDVVADRLRGPEKSFVSLTVIGKNGQSREMSVERRRVEVPCVENVRFVNPAKRVGYLRLTNFQKTTRRDVEHALHQLHEQGMKSLIIDLRGNPGGLLSAAVETADRFLRSGKILTTRGRNASENYEYRAHATNTWSVPLVVLIDHDSASASEIFAGAIADSKRGAIIGETSYGKGSVQGIFRMDTAKFGLCLTTAKFYSPSGRAISHNGVIPNIEVEPSYIAARPNDSGELTTDLQDTVLQRAMTYLQATTRTNSSIANRNTTSGVASGTP
ncbi:MAG TPA: peptidase S41 [Rhodopirellula sp.]|nr:peptidase S41 [Rhodopirellula sp.]